MSDRLFFASIALLMLWIAVGILLGFSVAGDPDADWLWSWAL